MKLETKINGNLHSFYSTTTHDSNDVVTIVSCVMDTIIASGIFNEGITATVNGSFAKEGNNLKISNGNIEVEAAFSIS